MYVPSQRAFCVQLSCELCWWVSLTFLHALLWRLQQRIAAIPRTKSRDVFNHVYFPPIYVIMLCIYVFTLIFFYVSWSLRFSFIHSTNTILFTNVRFVSIFLSVCLCVERWLSARARLYILVLFLNLHRMFDDATYNILQQV